MREKTAQFSSYDRASRYDEAAGKYIRWDANGDGDGFIRKEEGKFVFAEMTGPGCIWRIWSAAPKAGHVRIYLDGDASPAVDLPFADYFSGKQAPFTRPAIVHTVSQGCNNYTPIPFQKSCKIVADQNWGAYFHFGYTTFPTGHAGADVQARTFADGKRRARPGGQNSVALRPARISKWPRLNQRRRFARWQRQLRNRAERLRRDQLHPREI